MAVESLKYLAGKTESLLNISRMKAPVERVAGFEVKGAPRSDMRWQNGRASYMRGKHALGTRLRDAGIDPIAFLPEAWWEGLAEHAHLTVMYPDHEGYVSYDEQNEAHEATSLACNLSMMAAPVIAIILSWSFPGVHWGVWAVLGLIGAFLLPLAAQGILRYGPFAWTASSIYVLVRGGPAYAWRRMIREASEPCSYVVVSFPKPSQDMADTLLKVKKTGLTVGVAARPRGFRMGSTASSVISKAVVSRMPSQGRRRDVPGPLDGVLFARLDGVVALLNEEGDSRIGKDLIERFLRDPPYPMAEPSGIEASGQSRRALRSV